MTQCLGDTQLLHLLQGRLPSVEIRVFESHIDACPDCQDLIEDLARAELPAADSLREFKSLHGDEPSTEPYTISRRYTQPEVIGQGGMGQVFRVLDRLTGQWVALKRLSLRPSACSDSLSVLAARTGCSSSALSLHGKRLLLAKEFRTLASLRHPNIISVLDYGFDSEREPYFTMELLEDAFPLLPFAAAAPHALQIELLVELLRALSYLHRRGVLHRDLKPSNLLVRRSAAGFSLKVLDFGLALLRDEASREQAAGTLLYMAPELFRGEPASEASDLYAVGVLAYQVLTGRHPFSIGGTPQQIIAQVLSAEPALKALPEALRPVIGTALHKSPSERVSDAAAFSVELAERCGLTLTREPAHVRDSFLIGAQFTGRTTELRTLRQALLAAKGGLGSTWLIGGEAGVGKSRLLEELRSRALTEGLIVARGQAVKSGGSAWQVFLDVLKLLVLHRELNELSLRVLGTLIPGLSALVAKEIGSPEVLDAQDARLRLLRVLGDMLERIDVPTLILLEDLHWIDAESLGLLKRLTAAVRDLPVLIIGTYRNDESPQLPSALPFAKTLHLPRLSRMEMQQLCQSMIGASGQDPRLLGLIERETEGNTYFIVEAVRQLATASGSLMEIGRSELPERLPMLGIERLLEGRLGRVPADVQPFLRFAAVAGRRLELPVLAESWQQLEQMLQACAEAGVLELHEEQWRFSHDKLREGLLQRMSGEERARLHRHVAESLEMVYAGSSMRAAQVAHHFHQAGELSRASHYYSQAGQSALTRGATVEAVSAFEQALALLRPGTASQIEQVKAWRGLSQALYGLGRLSEAAAALQKVCELVGQPLPTSDLDQLWAIGREASTMLARQTHADQIWPQKPMTAEQSALSREVLEALSALECFIWQGQPMRVMLLSLRGLNLHDELGDPSLPRSAFQACIATLLSFSLLGGLALTYIKRTESPKSDKAAWGILLLRSKAVVALNSGQWTEALQHAESALELARKHERWLLHTLQQLMVALCDVDEFGRVLQVSRELEDLALRAQSSLFVALAYLGQGGAHLRFGNVEQAEALFTKARESGTTELGAVPAAILQGLSALCAVQAGRLDVAQQRADLALGSVRSAGWPLAQLRYALMGILSAYLAEGRTSLPPRTAEALAQLHRTARMFGVVRPADFLYHGLYDFRRGHLHSAHSRWRQGLVAAGRYRIRYEEGWTHYWLGRLAQTRLGRRLFREDPAAHFAAARAIFTRLEAAWDVTQVDRAAASGSGSR